jgi:hypothetical protein
MTKITDQREGAEQWEDELGKPFVAEHDRSDYSKELKGALGHGGVLVHSIEEGDVREDPWVVQYNLYIRISSGITCIFL